MAHGCLIKYPVKIFEGCSGGARGALDGATAPRQKHLASQSEDVLASCPRKFCKNDV